MDLDMHYHGTYMLARAAGLKRSAAKTIAYAAEYVDDSVAREIHTKEKGAGFIELATAHHGNDFKHNLNKEDQRLVWVPFHFIPGNEGDTMEERLVCRMDSKIAREMVAHNISQNNKPYFLELVGITAHVYADTFAHYGFNGLSSKQNEIINSTLKTENLTTSNDKPHGVSRIRLANFHRAIISSIREFLSGGLGHGAVYGYPDQPYLKWSFSYEHKEVTSIRDNSVTFMAGAKKLHAMFTKIAKDNPKYADDKTRKTWKSIESAVKEIICSEAPMDQRIRSWNLAGKFGELGFVEAIPPYDMNDWAEQKAIFDGENGPKNILKTNVYKFAQAASYHRYYVLRDLLPKHGIVVI